MNKKDGIVEEIERTWRGLSSIAWLDVAWLLNEVQWMRLMLRQEWPADARPKWVSEVLGDE